jgi:hypothetical protein
MAEDNGNTGARRVCAPRHRVALSKEATDYGVRSKNVEEVVGDDRFAERESAISVDERLADDAPVREARDGCDRA